VADDVGRVAEIPHVCAAETYERHDREDSAGVDAVERVEHVPHEINVGIDIFGLAEVALVPVDRASEE